MPPESAPLESSFSIPEPASIGLSPEELKKRLQGIFDFFTPEQNQIFSDAVASNFTKAKKLAGIHLERIVRNNELCPESLQRIVEGYIMDVRLQLLGDKNLPAAFHTRHDRLLLQKVFGLLDELHFLKNN